MPMVSYQTYTSIAFDVAEKKGAEFDGIQDGGEFISELAEYWSENERLKQMTVQQVRNDLEGVVTA